MSTAVTTILRPEDYGAFAGKDSTSAFRALMADVDSRLRVDPAGSNPRVSTVEVHLAGTYLVSGSIMRPAAGRAQGLTFRGIGKRASEIVMTGAEPLLVNADRWMGVRFYDMSFRSTNPEASFLYSTSTGGAQDWAFTNCEWRGIWAYAIGLDGPKTSNCNSEWQFIGCHMNGRYNKAWLWSGMTPSWPQQDQFLNFLLVGCKVEFDSGDALRFDKGGSIVVTGGSWIIKDRRPDGTPSRFFHFPAGSHYNSVQSLLVEGVRFEPRDEVNRVIESHWKGQVTFLNCMDDAWAHQAYAAADDYAPHQYVNPAGVRYLGCQFTGRHRYTQTAEPSRQVVVYDQCARSVSSRRNRSFLDVQGSHAGRVRVVHRDDRDGIT